MKIITGAGGFIGSVLVGYLNSQGIDDLLLFDDLPATEQYKNIVNKEYIGLFSADEMPEDATGIDCVIHLGANSNTLEKNWRSIYETNVHSTRRWSQFCDRNDVPFIFSSSAAIYGNGDGPLNQYAFSKQLSEKEINGVILRLFNVYGPNEYHKGRMASTLMHWHDQLIESGQLNIFQSSDQLYRDLVYVEDVAKTIHHFIENYQPGVYDVGTGTSVDFETVANSLIHAVGYGTKNFIEMPNDLKEQYQKDTKADIISLNAAGLNTEVFLNIEQGIEKYVEYLNIRSCY
jgi:ADP-L-glycero-D-manno-heptose 6-epimerase